jgi:hypothetical protein
MNINPYQSPAAETDCDEQASPDQSPQPLGLVDLLLLGAMVGILYHSAAGFLLGAGLGIVQALRRPDLDFYLAAGLVTSLSLLGAIGGVISGSLLGSLTAACYRMLPAWPVVRLACRGFTLGCHALVGGWACSWFVAEPYRQWEGGELSTSWFFFLMLLSLSSGLLIGWGVVRLVDGRIRKALLTDPRKTEVPAKQ